MTTPIYALGEWAGAQASPWVPHNAALRVLEAVSRGSVLDRDLTAPPGTCDDGACYLIAASATGAWATYDGKLAVAVGTDAVNGWLIADVATEGQILWVEDEAIRIQYVGAAWGVLALGSGTAGALDVDTDVTLAANSDSLIATQKAVKAYVDAAVVGLFDYKGAIDCSANPNYPAALKGDAYQVSVAGKIGGASGQDVEAGDVIVASADNAGGTQAAVGTSWLILNVNIAGGGGGGLSAASPTEVLTGTESGKAVTPDALAALWEKGSDIASAATISVGEGGLFHVTGTTTITDIDPATDKAGRKFTLVFDGALTLTHNATTLILPTGANITTAAGDSAVFVSEGSDAVRCISYTRASGAALAGGGTVSSQTGTSYTAVLGDANTYIRFSNASAITFTIPPNSSVAFPIGTVIEMEQAGAGALSVAAGSGVTINSRSSDLTLAGQYAVAFVKKVATDTWTMNGDL